MTKKEEVFVGRNFKSIPKIIVTFIFLIACICFSQTIMVFAEPCPAGHVFPPAYAKELNEIEGWVEESRTCAACGYTEDRRYSINLTEASLNSTIQASLNTNYCDKVFIKLELNEQAYVRIAANTAYNNFDSFAYLYRLLDNGEIGYVGEGDDEGGLFQFVIETQLYPGTYYLEVRNLSSPSSFSKAIDIMDVTNCMKKYDGHDYSAKTLWYDTDDSLLYIYECSRCDASYVSEEPHIHNWEYVKDIFTPVKGTYSGDYAKYYSCECGMGYSETIMNVRTDSTCVGIDQPLTIPVSKGLSNFIRLDLNEKTTIYGTLDSEDGQAYGTLWRDNGQDADMDIMEEYIENTYYYSYISGELEAGTYYLQLGFIEEEVEGNITVSLATTCKNHMNEFSDIILDKENNKLGRKYICRICGKENMEYENIVSMDVNDFGMVNFTDPLVDYDFGVRVKEVGLLYAPYAKTVLKRETPGRTEILFENIDSYYFFYELEDLGKIGLRAFVTYEDLTGATYTAYSDYHTYSR